MNDSLFHPSKRQAAALPEAKVYPPPRPPRRLREDPRYAVLDVDDAIVSVVRLSRGAGATPDEILKELLRLLDCDALTRQVAYARRNA